jgi:hypothetical protein
MRFVFIIGTGRCGSTLVQELLARHPSVGFVSNVDSMLAPLDLKGRLNPAIYARLPSALGRRDRAYLRHLRFTLAERVHLGPSEAYRLISRQISPSITEPFRDLTEADASPWLARRFREFCVERGEAQRASLFMHKFTGWPRARFINAVIPEARFIHVVRDGRSVASSIVQRPWWKGHLGVPGWGFGELPDDLARAWDGTGRSLVALAGLEWRILMEAFDAARDHVPAAQWMDIRYEDLVTAPRSSWERIMAFVDTDWNDAFEHAFTRQPVVPARAQAYRRDLAPPEIEMLEDLLGDHLRARGYDLGAAAG